MLQADAALSVRTGSNTAECAVVLPQLRVPQPHYGPRPGYLPRVLVEERSVHQYSVPSEGYGKPQESTSKKKQWPRSESEVYRPSDRSLSAKSVPTFADRGCHMVNVTDP
jgi:hypothetical protein